MQLIKNKLGLKNLQGHFPVFLKYTLPIILWAVVIFSLCVLRPEKIPSTFEVPGLDKLAHAIFYAVFTLLLLRRFSLGMDKEHPGNQIIIWPLCISIAYGIIIEVIQDQYFTYRSAEWMDVIANLAGSLTGLIAFKFFSKQISIDKK